MSLQVELGCTQQAPLLANIDGGGSAGITRITPAPDFHEYQVFPVPGDDIDFAAATAVVSLDYHHALVEKKVSGLLLEPIAQLFHRTALSA
jgi:hypothetical protein